MMCLFSLLLRLVGWAASALPHDHVLAREATQSLLSSSSSLHMISMMELCFYHTLRHLGYLYTHHAMHLKEDLEHSSFPDITELSPCFQG